MVGDSLGYCDHAEVACGVLGDAGCGVVGVVTHKITWVNDASNINDRRMYVDGSQWCKVYGWDWDSLNARCDTLQAAMEATTVSPHEARLILASMGYIDGAIRPGTFTALEKLALTDKLRACAAMEDGEK